MAEPILVLGMSGSGKSSSLRNFDPSDSFLVSVDWKRPPFNMSKWSEMTADNPSGSFYKPKRNNPYGSLKSAVNLAIKNGKSRILIDDSQYLLANEFFNRAEEKGFDKFSQMGKNFWSLIEFFRDLPDNVTVYMLHHLEYNDQDMIKPKTIGKMLDQNGCIEGRFTICLMADKVEDRYLIRTSMDSQSVIKSPIGMFSEKEMDNDLNVIDGIIRSYYGQD